MDILEYNLNFSDYYKFPPKNYTKLGTTDWLIGDRFQ